MYKAVIIAITMTFMLSAVAWAGVSGDARKANKLYKKEDYDKALEYYDRALSKKPDDQAIQYNRAAALYRKKKFGEAIKAFLNSLAGGEERLEEKTVYNVGNSEYRIGETMEKKDPPSAMANYKKALGYYKRAMELSVDDMDAKYNYEFTLKKIKELEQQQQQQQQQQQEQQEQEQQQKEKEKKEEEEKEKEKEEQEKREQEKEQQEREQREKEQQEREKREQEQREREQREQEQREQEQFPKEQKPDTMEEFEGEMNKEDAEMLLRGQDEEEARVRAEKRKAEKARRPPVLRDW
ncbi:MAG: tetratricopeptide repeat protein [Candidatus Omnitrophota bacterium]